MASASFDAYQTIKGQGMGRRESNPILGEHPSAFGVVVYFASVMALHAAVAAFLPNGIREAWQGSWTLAEGWQVGANAQSGISIP